MFKNFMNKLVKMAYPNRDVSFERIYGKNIIFFHTVSCNTYKLEGTYSYSQVEKLNELTTYSCGYGYCNDLGPVAFIGIPNETCAHEKKGDFHYKVQYYGSSADTEMECVAKYEAYPLEAAKKIGNYTVYGLGGLEEVAKVTKIAELNKIYDSRYKAKEVWTPRVFCMDAKVKGRFDYISAKILATGSLEEQDGYGGEDRPIAFGILENGKHVGLIGVWKGEANSKMFLGFKDVWEYNCPEPKVQKIQFIDEIEAKRYSDYSLYVYRYDCAGIHNRDKYQIEKYDRTLDKRFNFHLSDGTDYRLIPHDPC